MALETYSKKRNFRETPEPPSKQSSRKGALKFVVQRHQASHLHYDFRLEMDGVLKSWAVPKGPSMNPHDRRLAMMVEDHPFGYRTFEGEIPPGNYGAGIVEIWDEGTYRSLDNDDSRKGEQELLKELEEGNIKFVLKGRKLKGEFALVKMHGTQENAWLLIKKKDKHALYKTYSSEDYVPEDSKITKKPGKKPSKKKLTLNPGLLT
jgi:bifunctional non-homologous end joining protein LigD